MGRFPPPGFQPMARLSVDDSRLTLSVLRDIQLPPLYHRRRGLVKGFLGPAVRLPARFMDVIASHVLANALTPHVSACHCEPVPCPADTPQVSAYPTRQTVLQPQMRICLLHVIANQCAHLWQSVSPQGNLAGWQYLGRIRDTLRIRPKYCFLFCTAARSTDCHVASLLAMTCRNLPRVRIIPGYCRHTAGKPPCTRKSASSFCIPLRQTLLQPQRPYLLLHVIANQCAHLWQSASPQGNLAGWQYLGRIRDTLRIRPKYCFLFCTAARSTDCHVASLLAMTCRNLHLCAYATKWCHGKFMGLTYLP